MSWLKHKAISYYTYEIRLPRKVGWSVFFVSHSESIRSNSSTTDSVTLSILYYTILGDHLCFSDQIYFLSWYSTFISFDVCNLFCLWYFKSNSPVNLHIKNRDVYEHIQEEHHSWAHPYGSILQAYVCKYSLKYVEMQCYIPLSQWLFW